MARMQLGRMDVLPTHAKHVVLGAIAAAPTGLTERTIATLAWSPEIPPSRIPGLLNTYLRQGYITTSDGIYKPTLKLMRDRERWVTTRPPREAKPGAHKTQHERTHAHHYRKSPLPMGCRNNGGLIPVVLMPL